MVVLHGHAEGVEEDEDDDEPVEPLSLHHATDEEPEKGSERV